MEDPQPQPRRRTWFRVALRAVFLLVVAYPISIGPAAWFLSKQPHTWPTINAIYGPLCVTCDQVPLLHKALKTYIDLWAPGVMDQ